MKISTLQIKNFKKLKEVTIHLSDEQSIFVGANNSGKTSAIEAISKFLKRATDLNVYDFTIFNWNKIDLLLKSSKELKRKMSAGQQTQDEVEKLISQYESNKKDLGKLFPSLKVIISIEENELYQVMNIIPRLNKDIKQVAVFFRFEPDNYEELFEAYRKSRERVNQLEKILENNDKIDRAERIKILEKQWPQNFKDFLKEERNLTSYFGIKSYLSNPNLEDAEFPLDISTELEGNPLASIIKVDEINAQRALTDKDNDENFRKTKKLSTQFSQYYKKFEPKKELDESDATLVYANFQTENLIAGKLDKTFTELIKPLESFGYPAFGSPKVKVAPVVDIIKTIEGDGSILFNAHLDDTLTEFYLPENYNGLGFQNLISIFFELRYFSRERVSLKDDEVIKPIHLILIEEPEAHLHAQAQKVFVEKALEVIKEDQPANAQTQLVISTHSSHIADHVVFNDLLYFKREIDCKLPNVKIINLRDVVLDPKGKEDNLRFVERYLQITDHDVFFADAIIMIEGAAERILIPRMLNIYSPYLRSKYITIFEVGGSYAHRFLPWIKALGRPTLIITDIDTVKKSTSTKVHTTKNANKKSKNSTINDWFKDPDLKMLLEYEDTEKEKGNVRLTYQYINHRTHSGAQAYSRTFEDDFALTNQELFRNMDNPIGLARKYKDILKNSRNINSNVTKKLFEETNNAKTDFALGILFNEVEQGTEVKIPGYISEGFMWLEKKLRHDDEGEENETT